MPLSKKTKFILFLLRHRHWFRGKIHREVITATTNMSELRARTEKMAARLGKLDPAIMLTEVNYGGVSAESLVVNRASRKLILYFHGGGYTTGSAMSHRGIVSKFVQSAQVNAICFNYRLAPEHPFPAALQDSIGVYLALLKEGYSAEDIVFCGDSAGGGLALASLLQLRDEQLPIPAAAVLLSPWVDLTLNQNSYKADDPLAPPGSWQFYGDWYAGSTPKTDPRVSPLYADLSGLPPLLISVGEQENIYDEAVALMSKAEQAGVPVTRQIGVEMVHCFPVMAPMISEAIPALDAIGLFIKKALK